jgi:signal transduction histidine kinase
LLSVSDLMSKDFKLLDEEDKEQGIKIVNDSAKRIYKLLENLLTWSMAQTGKLIFEPMTFELKEIIKDNVLLHKSLATEKGVVLDADIPENTRTFGDREMINTVLRNLLSNAIKFTPSGKSVMIMVESLEMFWEIKIVDEGVGICTQNQEKIFHVGTKFKTEGTAGEKGSGLGLIICQEFVDKNGGEIAVISEQGKGSTFSFTLPKSQAD